MIEHVKRLCRDADICWHSDLPRVDRARCVRLIDCMRYDLPHEIFTAPIRSAVSYATALHEIGHHLGCHQLSPVKLTRERWAWQWARDNALIWTAAMERHATWALATHLLLPRRFPAQRRAT
jgi:hypothetical protein